MKTTQVLILAVFVTFSTIVQANSACIGLGSRDCYWTNCGTTPSNIGDVDNEGYELISWTKDANIGAKCVSQGLYKDYKLSDDCCAKYGSHCFSSYKRLWCKKGEEIAQEVCCLPCKKMTSLPKGGFEVDYQEGYYGRISDPVKKFCATTCNVDVSAGYYENVCPSD
jgi:hypothetical protein